MGEAIFDLEYVLRSKKEQLTLEEANVLLNWRAQALRGFTVGFGGGSFVTWLATQRLRNLYRLNITVGVAAFCGFWRLGRSVESSVDHILSLEGSRIQRELANIMLNKYRNDPWVLQRLSKHFYSEEVFDDSSVDRPKLRWRFRNSFGDHSHATTSHSEKTESLENDVKKNTSSSSSSSSSTTTTTTTTQPKQVYVNAAGDAMENPFDLVFGFPESVENVPQPDTPSSPSRREKRREKRSRRRHRRHHQEEESDI